MDSIDPAAAGGDPVLSHLQQENQRLKALLQQHGIDPSAATISPTASVAIPGKQLAPPAPPTPAPITAPSQQEEKAPQHHHSTSPPTAPSQQQEEEETPQQQQGQAPQQQEDQACPRHPSYLSSTHSLTKGQVERYSRQLLLPAFGLAAQEGLCRGSVLIVGCGGLGSPAAMYLAAAGVGRIGLVDHDVVELSNLHRQIIHTEGRVGEHKALSAATSCHHLNSLVAVEPHTGGLTRDNALQLVGAYDVVLDASDNPPTRYLISDACVVAGKPLVSAAAVGTDGQLTVYNHGPDGPCYRCLFPESPAPENCSRCADAGVLGPVPGVMGVLQAVEVVKVLGGVGDVMARKLLLFDALAGRFTSVKLRGKRPECVACGSQPLITPTTLQTYDYVAFTGQAATDGPLPPISLLPDTERLTVQQFKDLLQDGAPDVLAPGRTRVPILDVRPAPQVALFSFPGALHIPFERLGTRLDEVKELLEGARSGSQLSEGHGLGAAAGVGDGSGCESGVRSDAAPGGGGGGESDGVGQQGCGQGQMQQQGAGGGEARGTGQHGNGAGRLQKEGVGQAAQHARLVVLCRRGNNSQRAVAQLRQEGLEGVLDVIGGVDEWVRSVEQDLPRL